MVTLNGATESFGFLAFEGGIVVEEKIDFLFFFFSEDLWVEINFEMYFLFGIIRLDSFLVVCYDLGIGLESGRRLF